MRKVSAVQTGLKQVNIFLTIVTRLRQNRELQKGRLQDAKVQLQQFEGQMNTEKEQNRTLDRHMNSIKPKILQLQRSKQQYVMWVHSSSTPGQAISFVRLLMHS